MVRSLDVTRLESALEQVRQRLLDERNAAGHWEGEVSSSALSTATAIFAIHLTGRNRNPSGELDESHRALVNGGLDWLCANANPDHGWGDTVRSKSNLSTTCLCWAALSASTGEASHRATCERAEAWIEQHAGSLECRQVAEAITAIYGKDRTFSVPILSMVSLAGRLGTGSAPWQHVPALPFEFALLPRAWFKNLGLQVVSYALPALIALGILGHTRRPSRNPLLRMLRHRARPSTLRLLEQLQPSSGGFLEATPLTSFVTMSLGGAGCSDHPVVDRALRFLERSVRPDGSWPIDTNLATWLTTLSINALADAGDGLENLTVTDRQALRQWILGQQYTSIHPYTRAAPGGWAWTDLPGGVPDADDTAGALLALRHLGPLDEPLVEAARAGLSWLLDLQNRDGGIPTFCRGWGRLPFDRSSADLTAHALRAFRAWHDDAGVLSGALDRALAGGLRFLRQNQDGDGSWSPLWFGNQHTAKLENPVYGTARVIMALRELQAAFSKQGKTDSMFRRGVEWLIDAPNTDGGWGGAREIPSSVEETALAVEALLDPAILQDFPGARNAVRGGIGSLIDAVEQGTLDIPTPIGFYFARLWYFEKLYPVIFTAAALGRARRFLEIL